MLVVLYHIIHVMITIVIWAKFEHMNIRNSFCGTYLVAFLIVHGEKRTGVQIDHFCACCNCVTYAQLEEVSAALLTHEEEVCSDCSSVLLVIIASNYSCCVSGGTIYLCSL
jgi:hypothetical protein